MMTYGLKEEYYSAARERGIDFVRYELEHKPRVGRNGDKLEIHAREPVLGGEIVLQPDLLVLSPAMVPGDNAGLARQLGVELDADGFFGQAEVKFCPADTLKEGIYICGLAHAPCDVSETIVQAQSAAQRAAQLLSQATLSASDMISVVNERWCTGCELCVRVCPFDVRYKDLEKGVVKVREALCRGCGACVAACPSGASRLQSLTQGQLISMVDAAI
jgi:heterodisulfide reductase subunit A